jgi:hypothetical protein
VQKEETAARLLTSLCAPQRMLDMRRDAIIAFGILPTVLVFVLLINSMWPLGNYFLREQGAGHLTRKISSMVKASTLRAIRNAILLSWAALALIDNLLFPVGLLGRLFWIAAISAVLITLLLWLDLFNFGDADQEKPNDQ